MQAGATLNVSSGAAMEAAECVSTTPVIVVNGTMNATGASFTHTGTFGNSALTVNSGGQLMASNSTFDWSSLTLNSGSTDALYAIAMTTKLTINSGAAINIY